MQTQKADGRAADGLLGCADKEVEDVCMRGRTILIALGATSLLTMTTMPAMAQLDDFLCSTFTFHCEPPPPPAPALAPEPTSAPEPMKHAKKMHKKKMKKAKADADAAPEAAPK